MIKIIIFLLICILFCNCGEKKETINFITLRETEFSAKSFALPDSRIIDSIKHAHDSCMGFTFDANAELLNYKRHLIYWKHCKQAIWQGCKYFTGFGSKERCNNVYVQYTFKSLL